MVLFSQPHLNEMLIPSKAHTEIALTFAISIVLLVSRENFQHIRASRAESARFSVGVRQFFMSIKVGESIFYAKQTVVLLI